jgi:hypothetical protein
MISSRQLKLKRLLKLKHLFDETVFVWWLLLLMLVGALLAIVLALSIVEAAQAKKVRIRGKAEVIHIDRLGNQSEFRYFVHDQGKRRELKFKKEPNFKTDDEIDVEGEENADGSVNVETAFLTSVLPNVLGEQRTIVIMVNFTDNTGQPLTAAGIKTVFGRVSQFKRENSFNQTWLASGVGVADTVDVFGWFTLSLAAAACSNNYFAMAEEADKLAATAGAVLSQYRRKVYVFPTSSCGYSGMGTVGGSPSRAWLNGSGGADFGTTSHELGHNLGLFHSRSLCSPNCSSSEYGDVYDVMGNSNGGGHFNPYQKERLGWLDYGQNPPITMVTADGRYRVGNYESNVNEPKALKIFKDVSPVSGLRRFFYIHKLSSSQFYSGIGNAVVVHVGEENSAREIYLWDLDQQSTNTDWVLNVGQTYSESGASFTLVNQQADFIEVDVSLSGMAVPPAPTSLVVR